VITHPHFSKKATIHMKTNNQHFHGSDVEKVCATYNLDPNAIVNFAANVNPLGISKEVQNQLAKRLDLLSSYPDPAYVSLKETVGAFLNTPTEHMLVGNGTSELISLTIKSIAPKKTLLLGPTYSEYERELRQVNSSVDSFHLQEANAFAIGTTLPNLIAQMNTGYDLFVLCNPNNPTSSFVSPELIHILLDVCKITGCFMLVDETYIEFMSDHQKQSALQWVADYDNLMVLRGVSKFFAAPGLRVGYGITSSEVLKAQIREQAIPWSISALAAYAGELMVTDETYIEATYRLMNSEKLKVIDALEDLPKLRLYPVYANFFLVRILVDTSTAHEVFEACIKEGLLIRDCASFQNLDGEYFRFCLMSPEENDRLLAVLKNLFS